MSPALIAGAASLAIGLAAGWAINGWRLNGEIADMKLTAETQAESLRLAGQARINTIDRSATAKADKQAKTDRIIADKVDHHVPTTLPMLPGSFRLSHDAAATGEEANDPRAAAPAPVSPRTVARSITTNYQSAREDKERLAELQAVVKASGCFELGE